MTAPAGGRAAPPGPELLVCSAVRGAVGWDRVAVVATDGLDHRLPLTGSDPVLAHWGDLQQSLAEGPGADVLTTGAAVLLDDLRAASGLWPVLRAATPEAFPVHSLAVLPLVGRRAGGVVGVLAVARDAVVPFTEPQVGLLTALADLLAAVVVHRSASGDLFREAGDVGATSGDEVSVVLGMLAERLGTRADEALARLRAFAFSAGSTIHEVARTVLEGELDLDRVAGPRWG